MNFKFYRLVKQGIVSKEDQRIFDEYQLESFVGWYNDLEKGAEVQTFVFRYWLNSSPFCPACGSILGSEAGITAHSLKVHGLRNCSGFGKGQKKDKTKRVHFLHTE